MLLLFLIMVLLLIICNKKVNIDNILYLGGGLLTVFVLGVFMEFNALMYIIIENANTHMNYWEKQIHIIAENGNSIEVIGNDREINLYALH